MSEIDAPGLAMSQLLPASGLLLLMLVLALRLASSTSARFVVFACWLRFMLSSFHEVTFREVMGGVSLTALGSAGLCALGLILLPRRALGGPSPAAIYLVMGAILLSALVNRALFDSLEQVTKLALLLMIAVHSYRALDSGGERRFTGALLLSFAPLLLFQALSLLFDVPKPSEEGVGKLSYIGGYNHEAAFSIAVMAMLVVVANTRTLPAAVKVLAVAVGVGSILLANYRTAILAISPLLIYFLLYGVTRPITPRLRGVIATLVGVGAAFALATSVMTLDRYADLRTIAAKGTAIIKPPGEFSDADRLLLSGRTRIWSAYLYKWDEGDELTKLVGYGPESWQREFPVYAHNSFISFLFEYGIVGLCALVVLMLSGLRQAFHAVQHRWKLLAGHLSFIILNLATMPLWMIEGAILYGLLWGYTLLYRPNRRTRPVRPDTPPALKLVTT